MRVLQANFVLAVALFFGHVAACAQESILSVFSAEHVSGKVLLSWTVKGGSTCNGIAIFRSTDSLNFYEIGDIQGVCGNLGYPVNYTFTDDAPVANKVNYYRLELGSSETTYPIGVEVIDVGLANYYLKQNPIITEALIYFRNSNNSFTDMLIYDNSGILIKKLSTIDDFFRIDAAEFQSGMYYFTISNSSSEQLIPGRFIIQK